MADALKNTLSTPSNSYCVFEPNQVLDSKQLNSLALYFNYQEHLARAKLLGVGIVGGLEVSRAGDTVTVRKGVGVTTDGDALTLTADTVYSHFKPYGPASPRYAPFYVGDTMRTLFELVRDDAIDATTELLSSLPVNLGEMVVVMLMERCEDDPDLCSGTGCDNLGKKAMDTARVLLVSRGDASSLATELETVRQAALTLPALLAARPVISKSIVSAGALAQVYRAACGSIHQTLAENVGKLNGELPALANDLVTADWTAKLTQHQQQFGGNSDIGIQYYYDFLKDVVDTWNELRDILLADESVLCPEVDAFPRHLLLGDLTNPTEFRTGWFPSPLVGGNRAERNHARFLVAKLDAMINGFALPPTGQAAVRITPSRSEAASLEERAIPWFYPATIQHTWNFCSTRRGAAAGIYGYHTSGEEVFGRQIGRYDFFRIEGHIGLNVTEAQSAIEKAIAGHNLPFAVRAVLLHPDRKKIVVRPPIRYGDLHRIHHLLRKDLSVQLAETKSFNDKFKAQIDDAVKNKKIPDLDSQTATQSSLVKQAAEQAEPPLAKASYIEYQKTARANDWRGGYTTVINVANSLKGTLGDVIRTDYASAFDTLLTNNHPAWLDWVEALIQSKDDQEDDKLLFAKVCQRHPGLEHFGGVTRGGTFILVYDDQARVVADFMLPYRWAETAEDEPSEPEELKPPVYKVDGLFAHSIKVLPPLDWKFDQRILDFETQFQGKLKDQFNIQKDQLQLLRDFGTVMGGKPAVADPVRDIKTPLLKSLVEELDYKRRMADDLRNLIVDPATPDVVRDKSRKELERVEQELADTITRSSSYLVEERISMESGSDGSKAIAAISQSVEKITKGSALETLTRFAANVQSEQLKQVFKLRGL